MRLFHGTNVDIEEIDLTKCRPFKDFGQGFYLTYIQEQAVLMAKRTAKIYGGSPIVNIFELDWNEIEQSDLKILDFGEYVSKKWAQFVMNNRNKNYLGSKMNNKNGEYDIVIGPIADDNLAMLFRKFEHELISLEELVKGMEYKKTTNQISFHSNHSLKYLKKVGKING
ncbi:MAG: DUF3990 domain-containing protein [Bacillota bacterium]|nr:DUF3990 domain-containing protein [Bacillota bacterium]